jgi:ribonucleotide reductase alpha subunit
VESETILAIYLEPWHSDIELFLQRCKNHGDEELKARDLFYLWMPFMEAVRRVWTLCVPYECLGLSDVYGDEFKQLYESYETGNKGRKTMNARDLWFQILDAQIDGDAVYRHRTPPTRSPTRKRRHDQVQ